jgi:hypothetical protein
MRADRELVRHRVWEASDCVPGVCEVLGVITEREWEAAPDLRSLAMAHRSDLTAEGTDEDEFVLVISRWTTE